MIRQVTVAGYLVIAAAAALLEGRARVDPSTWPRFGLVLAWLQRDRAGRVGVLMAWWWLGFHFLAR